jgi:uncharacterized membrane protein (DUF4010 family)
MPPEPSLIGFILVLGLSLFFGLAFEEFHGQAGLARPGGVRTFPLLALCGGALYQLDATRLIPFSAGLLVFGTWLSLYYRQHLRESEPDGTPNVGIVVPVCNVLAYLLGPVALSQPHWLAVAVAVAAVLLLTARERLHGFAHRIEPAEIVTAGKFLILIGIVLPLLPDVPFTSLTSITPYKVWLALLAVCTVSYASYLAQRFLAPAGNDLVVACLGGLYSSTATTIVLARHAAAAGENDTLAGCGIILATAVMYVRILVIVAVFNFALCLRLALPMLPLAAAGLALAAVEYWRNTSTVVTRQATPPRNPLELSAAMVFALLFVVVSIGSGWALKHYGAAGVQVLAALVGFTDIDPFVLSVAESDHASWPIEAATSAILIATASNNVMKAAYTASFSGLRRSLPAAVTLTLLAVGAVAAALL